MTELPYFKFFPSEWLTGQISFEEFATKGAFTDLICFYWTKGCQVTEQQMKKITKKQHNYILDSGVVKIVDGTVKIDFLDKQLEDRLKVYTKPRAEQEKWEADPRNLLTLTIKQAYETK